MTDSPDAQVWQIVRAPKTVQSASGCQRGKKMPRTSFALSKNRGFSIGIAWDWCIYELEAQGIKFHLLIAFDQAKEQYLSWLGWDDGKDHALLGRLEYHPSHNGWHFHLKRGKTNGVIRGVVKEPKEKLICCDFPDEFKVSRIDAVSYAFRIFNVIEKQDGSLFQ